MRPAAAGLSDTAAHHQHVDDAAVVHVHVVPVVQPGTDDDHGAPAGLLRVECEFARHRDDLVARTPRDLFRPGRRVRLQIVVALAEILAAETAIDAVVGDEQIEHRRYDSFTIGELQRFGRHIPLQHIRMIGAEEMIVLAIAEIRKPDRRNAVLDVSSATDAAWYPGCRKSSPQDSICPSRPSGSQPIPWERRSRRCFRHRRRSSIPDCSPHPFP